MKYCLIFLFFAQTLQSTLLRTHQAAQRHQATHSDEIKQILLDSIGRFTDVEFARELEKDLLQADDSQRTMKEITANNAYQLFTTLNLQDPQCDENGDGIIREGELGCLNYAWKNFQPR